MSIEAATPSNSSGTASQNQQTTSKVDVAHFTPGGASSATPSDYKELSDVLLGEEIGMMGSEVEHWNAKQAAAAPTLTRSTSHFLPPAHPQTQRQSPSPMHHQQQARAQPQSPAAAFFACPPAQLTRHASLPVSMIRPHVQPVHVHHPHAMPFAIAPHHPHMVAMPSPSLARNRSHGYIMHAAPPHPAYGMPRLVAFHHPMTPTMAPDFHHVRAHHPMNSINLSVSHQQPTVPVLHKPVDTKNSNDHVEPIAFNGANDARMSLGEIDSLALAVLSEPSKDKENKASKPDEEEEREGKETESTDDIMFKPSTASSIGCGQDLEKALDSLDKFLPDADQDLFRPSEFRMSEFRMSDLRPSDLAGLVVPPPPQPSVASTLITPRTTTMPTGRAALPLIMSPHIKTIPSPAGAMTMMMNMPHMHAHTPRTSPKPMATCKVGGCDRRVRSKGFCKTHGGGRKCSIEGCKKSSQNGEFCIGHGGGKKCKQEGCAKAAQSHGLCKAHGGGARCKYPNCNKSSQGGGLCRAHGGGKRCQAAGCPKGAQRGNFCATHGGFRNCKIDGCVRTDRGGGFCEVHRRGRLCKIDGCKKLARNQGMCTMHIREDKQDEIELSVASLNVA